MIILCQLIAERKLIGKYADIAQKILPNSYVTVLLWLRKFELKQITRGNQSKLTKASPTLRYSAVAIAAGSRSAIPQMGRFEPSNKRCNNSAPVFQHPLFTFHPSFFLRPSLPPCLTFTLLPPSPSFSLLEVSPTLTRNPLFAKQTRIVCSQESGSVVVAEEHRRRRWRARNFNYTNIIGTRHNCIIGFGNWRSTSRVIRAIFLGNIPLHQTFFFFFLASSLSSRCFYPMQQRPTGCELHAAIFRWKVVVPVVATDPVVMNESAPF